MRSAQFGIYQIPTVMNQAVYLTLRGINVTDILIQHHQQVIIKAKFIFIFLWPFKVYSVGKFMMELLNSQMKMWPVDQLADVPWVPSFRRSTWQWLSVLRFPLPGVPVAGGLVLTLDCLAYWTNSQTLCPRRAVTSQCSPGFPPSPLLSPHSLSPSLSLPLILCPPLSLWLIPDPITFLKYDLASSPWCPYHTPTLCFGVRKEYVLTTQKKKCFFFSQEITSHIFSSYLSLCISLIWLRWLNIMDWLSKIPLLNLA